MPGTSSSIQSSQESALAHWQRTRKRLASSRGMGFETAVLLTCRNGLSDPRLQVSLPRPRAPNLDHGIRVPELRSTVPHASGLGHVLADRRVAPSRNCRRIFTSPFRHRLATRSGVGDGRSGSPGRLFPFQFCCFPMAESLPLPAAIATARV